MTIVIDFQQSNSIIIRIVSKYQVNHWNLYQLVILILGTKMEIIKKKKIQ